MLAQASMGAPAKGSSGSYQAWWAEGNRKQGYTAFAGDQPLSALLAARPIPQETFAAHSPFLDRMWPVHLEAALLQSPFTW